jgi:hypothetical protein
MDNAKLTMASLLGKTTVINLALSPKLHHFGVKFAARLPSFTQYCLDHSTGKMVKKSGMSFYLPDLFY